jgi:hypothetical protein
VRGARSFDDASCSPSRHLHRWHSQRGKTSRLPGDATDQDIRYENFRCLRIATRVRKTILKNCAGTPARHRAGLFALRVPASACAAWPEARRAKEEDELHDLLLALTVVIAMFAPRFPVISLIFPVILATFQGFAWFFKGLLHFTAPHLQGLQGSARKTCVGRILSAPTGIASLEWRASRTILGCSFVKLDFLPPVACIFHPQKPKVVTAVHRRDRQKDEVRKRTEPKTTKQTRLQNEPDGEGSANDFAKRTRR